MYYGDEIGLPGGNDPDNRRMMIFDDLNEEQLWLKDLVASLANYRSEHAEMLYGSSEMLVPEQDLLVINRQYFDHVTQVIFNLSDKTKSIDLKDELHLKIKSDAKSSYSGGKLIFQPNSFVILSNNP